MPGVLAELRRVLRERGVLLAAFQVGDEHRHLRSGYGGHPMSLWTHRRRVERVEQWLATASFRLEASTVREAVGAERTAQAFVIARRSG